MVRDPDADHHPDCHPMRRTLSVARNLKRIMGREILDGKPKKIAYQEMVDRVPIVSQQAHVEYDQLEQEHSVRTTGIYVTSFHYYY